MFYVRLLEFLKKQNILYLTEFGFREKHSTYMAILTLLEKITKAIDNDKFAVGIVIDFAKAFDTVNHSILLKKLYHYGIRGVAYKWLESYLSNRKQFCTYNGTKSTLNTISCGVPQGLFWALYCF